MYLLDAWEWNSLIPVQQTSMFELPFTIFDVLCALYVHSEDEQN